jgi:hypothetical protein
MGELISTGGKSLPGKDHVHAAGHIFGKIPDLVKELAQHGQAQKGKPEKPYKKQRDISIRQYAVFHPKIEKAHDGDHEKEKKDKI